MTLKPDVAASTDASPHWRAAADERMPELGKFSRTNILTWLAGRAGGRIGGGGRIKVLEAMGRSGAMALGYAPLGIRLVLRSKLTRVDCELATLRTAWNAGARYEWHHHVYAARLSGLSLRTVERVTAGPDAEGWTEHQRLLLRAVDELHADRMIGDATFEGLSGHLSAAQIADLCMLVGHYEMLAMLLKTHGVEPEPGMWRRGPLKWVRDEASGDGLAPSWLPTFNRYITNPFTRLYAGKIPPYSVIHHRGRKSGRPFATPVVAKYRDGLLIVPLPYGSKSDWLRNVKAAGGGEATYRRQTRKFANPRVVDAAGATELPEQVRRYTRLVQVMVADLVE
ncbi:nitroreductase family deazaflavin-dependent oxidoreductase [Nocardia huaxiensis]|uniref:nitroreductase family deazaflavin-dependent oxidoreductase n=1 Tax=Nocardia huaxiensis TaxID=2755382 RepID=UPI001E5892D1|nr:nitroreductase family deazaflavin-dependent oxidoreductase [Nocardia huaxiensis]UFS96878.1 nitroreductase family deazaflavin-dependent oxidoreductase [Nocardia huaxiensis]